MWLFELQHSASTWSGQSTSARVAVLLQIRSRIYCVVQVVKPGLRNVATGKQNVIMNVWTRPSPGNGQDLVLPASAPTNAKGVEDSRLGQQQAKRSAVPGRYLNRPAVCSADFHDSGVSMS